jgi:hypothetical protein
MITAVPNTCGYKNGIDIEKEMVGDNVGGSIYFRDPS